MKLYDFELSGNCYKIRLLLSLMDIPFQSHLVNLQAGEHKSPEFLQLNPRGQVPTLEDGDVSLGDSQAILVYIARKFERLDLFPQDAATQARVQYWLSLSANEVARGPADARLVKLFGAGLDYDNAVSKAGLVLAIIEQALTEGDWLVGDHLTIADISVFPYVALAHDADISLEPYPAIRAWIERIQALPGFVGMPGIPCPANA